MNKCGCNNGGLKHLDVMLLKNKISFLFWETIRANRKAYHNYLYGGDSSVFEDVLVENIYKKLYESDVYKRFKACSVNALNKLVKEYVVGECKLSGVILNPPAKEVHKRFVIVMADREKLRNDIKARLEILSVENIVELHKTFHELTNEINRLIIAKKIYEVSDEFGENVS